LERKPDSELTPRPPVAIRVLIAESDSALAELYKAALDANGLEVDVVADAGSVMQRFEHAPPTVLLVDNLPDADPVTIVERVRSLDAARDLVIVVMLDSMDRLDVQRLKNIDVQAWLSKTRTTREKLSETVMQLVAGRTRTPSRDQL